MMTELKSLIEAIREDLTFELETFKDDKLEKLLMLVLHAVNQYEEDERDGVDYLFNILNVDDVKCCLDGGMTIKEVAELYYKHAASFCTGYFLFGHNYQSARMFASKKDLVGHLVGRLEDLLPYVICYPFSNNAYKNLYTYCVTEYMTQEGLV